MPDAEDRNQAERLNREWDDFLLAGGEEAAANASPWGTAFRAVHAEVRRFAPEPDPAFVMMLRQRLRGAPSPRQEPKSSRPRSPVGVVHPALLPPASLLRRFGIAALLAIVIVGTIAGGSWLSPSEDTPIVASALASSIPGTATPSPTFTTLMGTALRLSATPNIPPHISDGFATVGPATATGPGGAVKVNDHWYFTSTTAQPMGWLHSKDVTSLGN